MSNILNKINKILSDRLNSLDKVIQENVFGENHLLNSVVKHIKKMNGKRIRVLLALLFGKIYNYSGQSLLKVTAAIEFIHNATLLHDDVIDNNTKRRGINSANKIWTNKICVLSGDFLLGRAFALISSINNVEISNLMSEASSVLIDGEIRQLIYNDSNDLNYKTYVSIIESKTAMLFSTATILAPILANAPREEIEALKNFGHYVGIAFQISDDLLDYLGTSKILGKPIGIDCKESKMTLPVILLKKILYENGMQDLWDKELWVKQKYSRVRLKTIIDLMEKYNISNIVMEYMEEYIQLAKNAITILKNKQPYFDLLNELIDFVVSRNV
jgi:octaprenyl-diphosphate synthase